MAERQRIIFHLDMDHFYTAVETRERPEIAGKPVVVGADPKNGKGRGVVSTSNYEARKVGIRSGMPISRAWKLCPTAIFLLPNFELYVKVSKGIMAIARSYANKFEQWGIDEAFLDVSGKVSSFKEAEQLAKKIKAEILQKQKLTCSIGIGPNKLIAKIASDFQKPDGLTVVNRKQVQDFLQPMPVRKLLWVGKKTGERLESLGIRTIGDLAHFDPSILVEIFGVLGRQMYLMAKGIDHSEVEERSKVKSVSHEKTFEEDTEDSKTLNLALEELSKEVSEEVLRQHFFFKTVTLKIRFQDFETHTNSKTLQFMTNGREDLTKIAIELLTPYIRSGRKIRLLGVRASNLISSERQKTLA